MRYIGVAEGATNTTAVMFTSVTYDSYGNMLTYTDESGHTTTYAYDRFGNVLTVTDAACLVSQNSILKTNSVNFHETEFVSFGVESYMLMNFHILKTCHRNLN